MMPQRDRSQIVADGPRRIRAGSGGEMAARLKARLMRRTSQLSEQATPVGRMVIRYRIWRFIRRQLARHIPAQGLYSERRVH